MKLVFDSFLLSYLEIRLTIRTLKWNSMNDIDFYGWIDCIKEDNILQQLIDEAEFCQEKQQTICNKIDAIQNSTYVVNEPLKNPSEIKGDK